MPTTRNVENRGMDGSIYTLSSAMMVSGKWIEIQNQTKKKAIFSTMKLIILSAICFSMSFCVESSAIHGMGSDFRVDPKDCSKFYIRRNGKEFQFKCPDDNVVNTFTRSCVPKGSSQDTCMLRVLFLKHNIYRKWYCFICNKLNVKCMYIKFMLSKRNRESI